MIEMSESMAIEFAQGATLGKAMLAPILEQLSADEPSASQLNADDLAVLVKGCSVKNLNSGFDALTDQHDVFTHGLQTMYALICRETLMSMGIDLPSDVYCVREDI